MPAITTVESAASRALCMLESALAPIQPRVIDVHLQSDKRAALCGAVPTKSKPYTLLSASEFTSRQSGQTGSVCSRCTTIAHITGIAT